MGDPRLPTPGSSVANPYKGLRSFEEADAAAFFGREGLTQELVERIAAGRFLASSARAAAASRRWSVPA